MTRLTRDDLSVIEGDSRVSCRRLQAALGIETLQTVHRLVDRNIVELRSYGEIISQGSYKPGPGRPKVTYLFNEAQALLICMFSRTDKAAEARRNLIEVFQAVRRGDLYALEAMRQQRGDVLGGARPQNAFAVPAEHAETSLRLLRSLSEGDEFVREVTHLPIWPRKRRPAWWHDIDVARTGRKHILRNRRKFRTPVLGGAEPQALSAPKPRKETPDDGK